MMWGKGVEVKEVRVHALAFKKEKGCDS